MGWAAACGVIAVSIWFAVLGINSLNKMMKYSEMCEGYVPFGYERTVEAKKFCADNRGKTSKDFESRGRFWIVAAFIVASPAISNIWNHKIKPKKKSEK